MMPSLIVACLMLPGILPDDPSPDARYQALAAEYDAIFKRFSETEDVNAALEIRKGLDPILWGNRFLELAEVHPKTKAAEQSLIWIVTHVIYAKATERALAILLRDHMESENLGESCAKTLYYNAGSRLSEAYLRGLTESSPHREVRGQAAYSLGRYLKQQAEWAAASKRRDPKKPVVWPQQMLDAWGADFERRLKAMDVDALNREAESCFALVSRLYSDVPDLNPKRRFPTLGESAATYLHELRDLAPGQPAPEIAGTDLDGKPFKLSDYRGKVVMLEFASHTFCGPCRDLYPTLRELDAKMKREKKPFALIAINADHLLDRDALKKEYAEIGNAWTVVFDDPPYPISMEWNVVRFPAFYFIDHRGVIRRPEGKGYEEMAESLLAEMEKDTSPAK